MPFNTAGHREPRYFGGAMSKPGVYVLVLHLPEAAKVEVGRLGVLDLPPGHYLYCGSAQAGLGPRLARHMRGTKVNHWHIDIITAVAEPIGAMLFNAGKEGECLLARILSDCPLVSMVKEGFGSSDCHCPSHLFLVPEGVPLVAVMDVLRSERLEGRPN
jgi:sugar fermentation stimulation protein A